MKYVKGLSAALLMALLYCVASTSDWTEEVIQMMSEEEYQEALAVLGEAASDYEIARYYVEEMQP